jgi:hypothetical protein
LQLFCNFARPRWGDLGGQALGYLILYQLGLGGLPDGGGEVLLPALDLGALGEGLTGDDVAVLVHQLLVGEAAGAVVALDGLPVCFASGGLLGW